MRAMPILLFSLLLCATTVDADTITIPQIKAELDELYQEQDALEAKAAKQKGVLNYMDRQRYIEVLRDIEALEELLRMYNGGYEICHELPSGPMLPSTSETFNGRTPAGFRKL